MQRQQESVVGLVVAEGWVLPLWLDVLALAQAVAEDLWVKTFPWCWVQLVGALPWWLWRVLARAVAVVVFCVVLGVIAAEAVRCGWDVGE